MTALQTMNANASDVPRPAFRWATRVLLPGALLAAFAAMILFSLRGSFTNPIDVIAAPAVERAAIRATAAAASDAAVVQAAGWIEPAPFPIIAAALTDGTVAEVFALEGDRVEAGAALARLSGEDAHLAMRRAEAEWAAAEEAWTANIEGPRAASVARAAERETSASLAMAHAELAGERALLVEAERTFERRSRLRASGSVSESNFNAAEAELGMRRSRLEGAGARVAMLAAQLDGARAEATAAVRRAELRTEERLRRDAAQVGVEEARLRVARLDVRAPAAGVVLRRLVEPGSRIVVGSDDPAAAQVAHLFDPARLQVRVDVPLADAPKIAAGQAAEFECEALPGQVFRGRVARIGGQADIQKNTVQAKVVVDPPGAGLKPDMLVRVRFLALSASDSAASGARSVFVRKDAVSAGSAWVVSDFDGEEGIVERRAVELTGGAADEWVEVASGIRPGDLVVLGGAGLSAGTRVRVRREGGS